MAAWPIGRGTGWVCAACTQYGMKSAVFFKNFTVQCLELFQW